jgi:hypothetical protein
VKVARAARAQLRTNKLEHCVVEEGACHGWHSIAVLFPLLLHRGRNKKSRIKPPTAALPSITTHTQPQPRYVGNPDSSGPSAPRRLRSPPCGEGPCEVQCAHTSRMQRSSFSVGPVGFSISDAIVKYLMYCSRVTHRWPTGRWSVSSRYCCHAGGGCASAGGCASVGVRQWVCVSECVSILSASRGETRAWGARGGGCAQRLPLVASLPRRY